MKVKIHNLAIRIFPIVVSFCIIVSFLVYPAFAKVIDYNDYISNVSVNGDNDIVTVCLPAGHNNVWYLKSLSGGTTYKTVQGNSFDSYAELPDIYKALYYPIDPQDLIDILYIPNGTMLNLSILIEADQWIGNNVSASFEIQYYDQTGTNLIGSAIGSAASWDPNSGDKLSVSIALNKLDGACFIKIRVILSRCENTGSYTVTAQDLYFTMSISSMLRLQQETGRTNKLLEQVLDSLNQNSGGAAQDFQDSIVNQDQQLDQMAGIMDSIDRPDAGSINVSIDDYVSPSDMQNVSSILSVLFQSDLLLSMLMILLTMSIAAYVLFGKRG